MRGHLPLPQHRTGRASALYVVQFGSDSVAELRLSGYGATAEYVRILTDRDLDLPTAADC